MSDLRLYWLWCVEYGAISTRMKPRHFICASVDMAMRVMALETLFD